MRAIPWLLVLLALAGTLVLVLRSEDDLRSLRDISLAASVGLVVFQLLYLAVQSARFHVVIARFAEHPVGFWPWTRYFVIGRFLNLFVPQAGNVYRAVELKRQHHVSIQRFLVAFVNAPWLAMILNFLFGAVAVWVLAPQVLVSGYPLWLLLLAATAATALAPLLAVAVLPLFPQRLRAAAWLRARLQEMVAVTFESLREPAYLLRVTFWTLVAFVQASIMLWLGFLALGTEVGVAEAVAFYVLLQLTTYVQLTPGNLGLQELAFAALSAGFGASAADGVLVSTIVRVTGVVALVVGALPLGGFEALRVARVTPTAAARSS
jgi:uncharacterized membrane protein YbhN (UPF0104 family)